MRFNIESKSDNRELILIEEFKIDKINNSVEENDYIKIIKKTLPSL